MDADKIISLSPTDRSYVFIKKMLMAGELPPGHKLSYAKLSREIKVSATPVREAVNRLASEGLIELIPNVGAIVRKMTRQDIRELYEVRELLEGYAAGQCAQHISRYELAKLQGLIAEQRALIVAMRGVESQVLDDEDNKRFFTLDVRFHQGVVKGAMNTRLAKMINEMRFFTLCSQLLMKAEPTFSHLVSTYRYHRRILRALERGHSDRARQETVQHIRAGLHKQLVQLDSESSRTRQGTFDGVGVMGDVLLRY